MIAPRATSPATPWAAARAVFGPGGPSGASPPVRAAGAGRPLRLGLVLVAAVLASGCESIIGARNKPECAADPDCPPFSTCVDGRCVEEPGGVDAGLRPGGDADAAPPDAAPADAAPPDATPARPDAGPAPFGEDGDCFGGELRGGLAADPGDGGPVTSVPRAFCTPEVLAWLVRSVRAEGETGDGLHLHYRRGPDDPIRTVKIPRADRLDLAVSGGTFLLVIPNERRDGFPNVARLDVRAATPEIEFVDPRPTGQTQPALAGDLAAFVEELPRGDGVVARRIVVRTAEGERFTCGGSATVQWGPAFAGERVAWFERPLRGGPTRLVVARTPDCTPTLVLSLRGEIAADARLHGGERHLAWLAVDPASRRRRIHLVDLGDPAAGATVFDPAGLGGRNAVELALRGDRLAVSSYSPGRHVIDLFDLDDGRHRPVERVGNARRPFLSGRYLLWAEQRGVDPWEIRYVALAP